MIHNHNRKFKNIIINKNFQIQFLLRFFAYTFIILSIGSAAQYYISNRTILNELDKVNTQIQERQTKVKSFINGFKQTMDASLKNLPPNVIYNVDSAMKEYKGFLASELDFMNTQTGNIQTILVTKVSDLNSAFWGSMIFAGVIINFIFAVIYGLVLSHKFAGNHYRLQKFAKQLQERNLASPLKIRTKDFFQETAVEFDKARVLFYEDMKEIKKGHDVKDVVNRYKLD